MFKTCKKPPMSIMSVSGNVCSFNSLQEGLPLKSHVVQLVATQSGSGTPSPQNIRSINGYNDIDIVHNNGTNILNNSLLVNAYGWTTLDIVGEPNTEYVMTTDLPNSDVIKMYILSGSSNYPIDANNPLSVVSSSSGRIRLQYRNLNTTDYDIANYNFYVERGSTKKIQIGSTVYGGEYDARTGVLTVTHNGDDLGALTWTKESNHFYSNILSDAKYPPNNSNVAEIMCESYKVISEANAVSEAFDYSIGMSRTGRIYIYDSSLSSGDATAFTTAVTGVKLVYALATPTTIQLPPCPIDTLLGENNIWADTGNTSLEAFKFGR